MKVKKYEVEPTKFGAPRYSEQFIALALRSLDARGSAATCQELGINRGTLRYWKKRADREARAKRIGKKVFHKE